MADLKFGCHFHYCLCLPFSLLSLPFSVKKYINSCLFHYCPCLPFSLLSLFAFSIIVFLLLLFSLLLFAIKTFHYCLCLLFWLLSLVNFHCFCLLFSSLSLFSISSLSLFSIFIIGFACYFHYRLCFLIPIFYLLFSFVCFCCYFHYCLCLKWIPIAVSLRPSMRLGRSWRSLYGSSPGVVRLVCSSRSWRSHYGSGPGVVRLVCSSRRWRNHYGSGPGVVRLACSSFAKHARRSKTQLLMACTAKCEQPRETKLVIYEQCLRS